jgi:hypothetical protein
LSRKLTDNRAKKSTVREKKAYRDEEIERRKKENEWTRRPRNASKKDKKCNRAPEKPRG